ncbi:hypothetical protein M0R45_031950 [Rubus argutus]|uniref:Integrase catalytic domain-containing protein n=1 Tax=Rubus argutus TaxID=59490 RepID=A0AAW1WHB5_RUBAR
MGAKQVLAFSDSQFIVNQVTGDYQAKDPIMRRYAARVKELTKVPRNENQGADALARIASGIDENYGNKVPVSTNGSRTIENIPTEVLQLRLEEPNWMVPILNYLKDGTLRETRTRQRRSDIGLPGTSSSMDTFTAEPTQCLICDALDRLNPERPSRRQCKRCQLNAPSLQSSSPPLATMVNPCPFAQWGLDLIEKLPKGTGGVEYVVVATDYSTKWTKAKALKSITSQQIQTFVWENIICRFGIPRVIVTDNGTQLDSNAFRNFCQEKGITPSFASVAHPQTNGQVEAVNKILKRTMRTKLGEKKGAWPELLPEVLWAYRTSYKAATGETPFSLAFGAEAVVPVEINVATHRIETFDPNENEEQLCLNRDLLEERREQANLQNAEHKIS